MARQLLERDPTPRSTGHEDELEASSLCLAGERPGQGQDRPQADDEREEDAVLVLQVAAQRTDVDDLAGHPLQDRRDGSHEGLDLGPRLGRVELGGDRPGDTNEHEPEKPGDDERRATRVANGLGEDAAETVNAAPGRWMDGYGLGRDGHCWLASTASLPYSARNVSSSEGSRLMKSARSYCEAARTIGVMLPKTRMRRMWSSATTSETPGSALKAATGTWSVNTSSTV